MIAGCGQGAAFGLKQNCAELWRGGEKFRFQPQIDGVAGIQQIIHRIFLQERGERGQFLFAVDVFAAPAENKIE